MVLQDKEVSRCEDHQTKSPPMLQWRHATMEGELLVDLLPSGQLGVSQDYTYSDHFQRASHQVSIFCSILHPSSW